MALLWLLCAQVNFFLPLLSSKTVGGCLLCAACWEQSEILLWMPLLCLESMDWQWGRGCGNMPEPEMVSVHSLVWLQPMRLLPQLESLFPAGRKGVCHIYTYFLKPIPSLEVVTYCKKSSYVKLLLPVLTGQNRWFNYAVGRVRVEKVCEMPDKNKGQIIKRISRLITL